jgi:hypothetical protein
VEKGFAAIVEVLPPAVELMPYILWQPTGEPVYLFGLKDEPAG